MLTSQILQRAPNANDPQLNSNDLTRKVPYICSSQDCESKIFICFALRSATFKIFAVALDSDVKVSKCHKIFKTWPITKKSNSLYSPTVSNVLTKLDWHWMKTVRWVTSCSIRSCVNKKNQSSIFFYFWRIASKRSKGLGTLLGHLIARQEKFKFNCLLGMKRQGK